MVAVICMIARWGGPLSGTQTGAATCVFGVFCVWTLGQRAQWPRRARAVPRRIVPRWPEPRGCSGMCFPGIVLLFLSLAVFIMVFFCFPTVSDMFLTPILPPVPFCHSLATRIPRLLPTLLHVRLRWCCSSVSEILFGRLCLSTFFV